MGIVDILEGHRNEFLNKNDDLFEKRMEICKNCPLYKASSIGPLCNPRLYINESGDVSDRPKIGYQKGCGCRLKAKTRLESAHCVINKW